MSFYRSQWEVSWAKSSYFQTHIFQVFQDCNLEKIQGIQGFYLKISKHWICEFSQFKKTNSNLQTQKLISPLMYYIGQWRSDIDDDLKQTQRWQSLATRFCLFQMNLVGNCLNHWLGGHMLRLRIIQLSL